MKRMNDATEVLSLLRSKREELLKDLTWREPDVRHEHDELKRLESSEDPEAIKLLGAQKVVVETAQKVLDNVRAELEEVDDGISTLEEELKRRASTERKERPGSSE